MDTNKLDASIFGHEGKRLHPYVDTRGNISIGIGRNLKANGISEGECQLMYDNDRSTAITAAQQESWWDYIVGNDARENAMIEMVFNMGTETLREFKVAINCLSHQNFVEAADAFMDSAWANEVGKGPGKRATVLTDMIRTGEFPSLPNRVA